MNGKGPSLKNLQYCKFTTINNASQTILGESGRKINRIWLNQGVSLTINQWSHVYMTLKSKYIGVVLIQMKFKSGVAEIFIRTLKKKIYKDMTSASKNMYIDKPDEMK